MAASHKKPGVAFWATVIAVVGLVAYPLSLGPACWISSRTEELNRIPYIYWPMGWLVDREGWVGEWASWYAVVGMPRDGMLWVPTDSDDDVLLISAE